MEAAFDIRDFLGETREALRIRAELRAESLGDGPPARAAPKRPRGDPDATDSDDDDERDDTCACCGRSTLTAAGLAMKEVLICENQECRAECHRGHCVEIKFWALHAIDGASSPNLTA